MEELQNKYSEIQEHLSKGLFSRELDQNISNALRLLVTGYGEKITISHNNLDRAIRVIDDLLVYLILGDKKEGVREITQDLLTIMDELNSYINSITLQERIEAIRVLLKYEEEVLLMIEDYRQQLKELEITKRFRPPSFAIKKDYLDEQRKRLNKGGK